VLPAFVIGLREGLETVVVLGAIVLFLSHQGRGERLRSVWVASFAAAGACGVLAVALHLVQASLSTIAENRFEAVVAAAAVLTVTYMVVWMRRFPKDLVAESGASAASRFSGGSGRALVAMAFFAVLREGFEITVFVVALVGARTSSPPAATAGALAGVAVAVGVGVALVRGAVRFDVTRFFRATALVLVVSAAGLAMTAIYAANAGGWLVYGQSPRFDWARWTLPGTAVSAVVTGVLGIQPYPVLVDVVVWLAYLIPMLLVVIVPYRSPEARRARRSPRQRRVALMVCAEVAVVAVAFSAFKTGLSNVYASAPSPVAQVPVPAGGIGDGAYLLFRNTDHDDDDFGRLAVVPLNDPTGPRAITSLSCDRVDFEGGRGLCVNLPTSGLEVSTSATIFDSHFKVLHQIALTGYPSRTRVSPDGRYGAVTTFVTGDSYAAVGSYSTRTVIIDMRTGAVLLDLEQLSVTRHGKPFHAADFNFWGVTFTGDGRQFYATLGTGGQTYLIRANVPTRRATVVTSNVACPSLSPNGKDIAFKRQVPGRSVRWRLSVLDLATGKVHPLAETRSIDDQVEWLNDSTILYGVENQQFASGNVYQAAPPSVLFGAPLVTKTWSVPADGGGRPRPFNAGTWSEVVTRRAAS